MVNNMNDEQQDLERNEVRDIRFWRKIGRFGKRAGREVLEKALMLFYVAKSDQVPKRLKAVVVGALAYFISTIDAIPDITPLLGFTDDLGILVAAAGAVAAWIDPEIQAKVEKKLQEFFGEAEEQTDGVAGQTDVYEPSKQERSEKSS